MRTAHLVIDMGAFEYQGTLRTAAEALAANGNESTRTINGLPEFRANDEACRLVARLQLTGTAPV